MSGGSFRVGQALTIKSQRHRVLRDLGNGIIAVEELSTGKIAQHVVTDLLTQWKAGDLILEAGTMIAHRSQTQAIDSAHLDAFRQSYSEADQDRARTRLVFVERLEKQPRTLDVMTPLIEEIWNDKKLWVAGNPLTRCPHFTTVVRWIAAYLDSGRDIRALVDRHDQKGSSASRVNEAVKAIVDSLIETRYLTLERPTLKAIRNEAKGLVAARNTTRIASDQLRCPSYAYFKARLHEIAPYDVYRARYGQRAADIKFRAAGRGVVAPKPLARASMDHCRMDLFVVDDRTGLPLGRPWLTLVIDEHSRYVLGYYLGFEEPSIVSMTAALRHAIAPKESCPDTRCDWDAWGVFDLLVVDNGLEFHARALTAGAGRYGIDVQWCPRRKPWFKGKVERFFGTLNTGLLVDMRGKTFSSVLLKGDYDPATHAVLTLATLRRVLQIWIVDVYHQEVHSGLGMTPRESWTRAIPQVDRYLPPSSVAMEAAFSASCLRKLTHKGIEFDSLLYNCPQLGALRELHGSEFQVEVRTCDADLGHVVVVSPDQITLIKVPSLDPEYALGLTRWQHKVCKRFQRRVQEDDAREISLLEARQRIRALILEDMRLGSRKSRKTQQRFLGDGPSRSGENAASAIADPVRPGRAPPAVPANESSMQPAPVAESKSATPNPSPRPKLMSDVPEQQGQESDVVPTFASRRVRNGVAA